MNTINVLTEGFKSPNGLAFISPLIIFHNYLKDKGIRISFHSVLNKELEKCDVMLIESKFFRSKWANHTNEILKLFTKWRKQKIKLIFCDTTDSSSWIKNEVFDYVDKYAKGQLLKNRKIYLEKIYASRLYADFYFKKYNIKDSSPYYSKSLRENQIDKLCLSWNSGLSNYSFLGPLFGQFLNFSLAKYLWRFSYNFSKPSIQRSIINCRFGNSYNSESIRYQRSTVKKKLSSLVNTKKLNRLEYCNEMKRSLISIVPFGYGEITLKDFESFLNGCILFKPKMSHMITWPNFYIKGSTFIEFSWDIKNLKKKIEFIKDKPEKFIEIAKNAQSLYKKYTIGKESSELFYNHFRNLIK